MANLPIRSCGERAHKRKLTQTGHARLAANREGGTLQAETGFDEKFRRVEGEFHSLQDLTSPPMPIPPEHSTRFIYHFTLIDNLPGILEHGFNSPNEQIRLGLTHHSIAHQGIQNRRATMAVTCGPGGVVHDYVPFYLCKRSSMLLAVVNAKNVDQQHLIYLAFPISLVKQPSVVFTDASANTDAPPNFFSEPDDLARLNWDAINSMKWSMPNDAEKQARMAEVLVHQRADMTQLSRIIVWNDHIRQRVYDIFHAAGMALPTVNTSNNQYFTKWPSEPTKSLVTGPVLTTLLYHETIELVRQADRTAMNPRFQNIGLLLEALRINLTALPDTAELIGLRSDNPMHQEDAGTHTLSVVRELRALPEFAALSAAEQQLVELAAFLHDIGKGPATRWASNNGIQKADPDHPIGSVKLLRRILIEEVAAIDNNSLRVLAKLVCYHDLIGDIIANGRKPEQLEAIADNERDLDMLIALNLADVSALNEGWFDHLRAEIPALRQRIIDYLNRPAAPAQA